MASHEFSRRHFFYGALLAGAVPSGGFGSTPSLKSLGYKSPNEKLNIAGIGAGGQPFGDLRGAEAAQGFRGLGTIRSMLRLRKFLYRLDRSPSFSVLKSLNRDSPARRAI